jgi:hypothetical protein
VTPTLPDGESCHPSASTTFHLLHLFTSEMVFQQLVKKRSCPAGRCKTFFFYDWEFIRVFGCIFPKRHFSAFNPLFLLCVYTSERTPKTCCRSRLVCLFFCFFLNSDSHHFLKRMQCIIITGFPLKAIEFELWTIFSPISCWPLVDGISRMPSLMISMSVGAWYTFSSFCNLLT